MPGNGRSDEFSEVLTRVEGALGTFDVGVSGRDLDRPWGGFLVLCEADLTKFVDAWFPGAGLSVETGAQRFSPKMLIVAPGLRLSWQYHRRRREMWRVVEGPVGISRSPSDSEPPTARHEPGAGVRLELGERHRLTGLENWGVVAEIWEHADPAEPSDELDIVRVADDHSRA